ncbi:MAG: hypothetical protein HWN67_20065 [Candidatus Helarchaeota archaeon]|nr:hypothetical protein [Candidatus Helarchaeota archaeon]
MTKFKRSAFIILVVLLFAFFISGCYTMIHPPFTVEERVTKVIVKENESDRSYNDEEYQENNENISENSENETNIYYFHNYYPYYDPFYYRHFYGDTFWYRYHHRPYYFRPQLGFGFRYHFWSFPWDVGFYYYMPGWYPDFSIQFSFFNYDCFAYWDYYYPWYRAYHPFAYVGHFPYSYYGYRYGYYPYSGYNYSYAYYRDYGPAKPYKKRDFGRRQDYRVSNANMSRIIRSSVAKTSSDQDVKELSKRNDGKNTDSYKGRRTRRDEYSGTRTGRSTSIKKSSTSKPSGSVKSGGSKRGITTRRSSRGSGSSGSSSTGERRTKRKYDSKIKINPSIDNKNILKNRNVKNYPDYNKFQESDFNKKGFRERLEYINEVVGSYKDKTSSMRERKYRSVNSNYYSRSKNIFNRVHSSYIMYGRDNHRFGKEFTTTKRYSPPSRSSEFRRGYSPSSRVSVPKPSASHNRSSSSSSRRERR